MLSGPPPTHQELPKTICITSFSFQTLSFGADHRAENRTGDHHRRPDHAAGLDRHRLRPHAAPEPGHLEEPE